MNYHVECRLDRQDLRESARRLYRAAGHREGAYLITLDRPPRDVNAASMLEFCREGRIRYVGSSVDLRTRPREALRCCSECGPRTHHFGGCYREHMRGEDLKALRFFLMSHPSGFGLEQLILEGLRREQAWPVCNERPATSPATHVRRPRLASWEVFDSFMPA